MLEYILYRYKFKEYPKKKLVQNFQYIFSLSLYHLVILNVQCAFKAIKLL